MNDRSSTWPALVRRLATPLALWCALGTSAARADATTDWNVRAADAVVAAGLITQPANRVMALSHTAAFEAVNAITRRYPSARLLRLEAPATASADAAVAAAHHTTLVRLLPTQQTAIDQSYRTALSTIADGPAKDAGIAVGERAALDLLALRADDGSTAPEAYRPFTTAGRYVPTLLPVSTHWVQRKPWLMDHPAQFRPGPPPALDSERWARDYNEIKAVGERRSTVRSPEQSEIARFWETTLPPVYQGLVRSVALMPGRDLARNARLFAAVTQALDDAMIAVFDAKYHHGFWRPITAIRNGNLDGHDATQPDTAWLPFLNTPPHPEYPCAHCIQVGVVGAVLHAELGRGPHPTFSTASASANGAVRRWNSIGAFVQEVGNARVYEGVHFRTSTEVGIDMGQRIGALAVQRYAGE